MSLTDTMLVTGGAGFIGSNFVRHALRATEARIVVVDKLTYAGNLASLADVSSDPRYAFVHADVADTAAMAALFRAYRPTRVFHFAAESHVDRSIDEPRAFVRTNITGTFELLEAARSLLQESDEDERSRFRFVHVSTDEVYGTLGSTGCFTEGSPYAPNSPYAASKAAADQLVRAWHATFRVPTVITNSANNYGPYQLPEKLIPLMILNALDGRALPLYGDGRNVRDWLYVDDHCAGVLLAAERGRPGSRYNLGAENERTNEQVVDAICAALDEVFPVEHNAAVRGRGISSYTSLKKFVEDRPAHDRRYSIDSTRARAELEWRAVRSFDVGLRRTVEWYIANRAWCDEVLRGKYRGERLGLEPAPSPTKRSRP